MRVAVLTASVSRRAGGLFTSVRRLSEELARCSNGKVAVFAPRDEWTNEDLPGWRLPVVALRSYGPSSFCFTPRMAASVNEWKPEIVHVHGLWTYLSVLTPRLLKPLRPYIVSPRGMLDGWALRNSAWKKKIATILYEHRHLSHSACIHALCASEAVAIRQFGVKQPICLIPNGVDLPAGEPLPPPAWAQRIPPGSRTLLFLGRIHPKKGLVPLLRAWSHLPQEHEWHLVIAGWDQNGHQAELETLAERLGIAPTVSFVGPLFGAEKAASLRYASAFVLPSFSEGLPMAVLEAWAYHLPVLFTPHCNLPEGASAGAALSVEPTVPELTEALRELTCLSRRDLQEMGQQGFQLVQQRFSWSALAQRMHAVYTWILGGGSPPADVLP